MKRILIAALACLLPVAASAATELNATGAQGHEEQIKKVEAYLSGLTTVVSDFSQVAPDGTITSGKFYMKRPGKMRWQYNPPTPILIISDGKVLTYFDYDLEQVSYVPIDDSLVSFLAREKIRFSDKVLVEGYVEEKDAIRITVVQKEKPTDGKLTLEFSTNPLQIRSMVTTDATGQVTSVALNNAQFGTQLPKDLFVFHDPRKRKRI